MATPIPRNQASFELGEIARAVGGGVVGSAPLSLKTSSVSTDSRNVDRGALFVALRGEKFDGHAYCQAAYDAGAHVLLVERGRAVPAGAVAVEVDDTLTALGALANLHRARWGGFVACVTGSVGKTTTKELLAAALGALGRRVHRTEGNLNNLIGVPLTLFQLGPQYDCLVLEIGTSAPGEIAKLTAIGAPDAGVITAIAAGHLAGLGSIDGVRREKGALLHALKSGAVGVVPGVEQRALSSGLEGRGLKIRTFGAAFSSAAAASSEGDDVALVALDPPTSSSTNADGGATNIARYRFASTGDVLSVPLGVWGQGAALNAAAALAFIDGLFGFDAARNAASAFSRVYGLTGRFRVTSPDSDRWVIDDTYNANPESMACAIESARSIADVYGAELVCIFGDMLDLGDHAPSAHRAAVEHCVARGVKVLAGCGPQMSRAVVDFGRALGAQAAAFDDPQAAAGWAQRQSAGRAVFLVKGSRGMKMERAVAALGTVSEVTP